MRLPQKNEKGYETAPVNELFDQIQGVYQPWSAPVLHLTMPTELLNNMIELTDLMAAEPPEWKKKESLSGFLAGEIDNEMAIDAYMFERAGFLEYVDKAKMVYLDLQKRSFPVGELGRNESYPPGQEPEEAGYQATSPVIIEFERRVIESKLISVWFNDMQDGEYNPIHTHDGLLSGVAYLKVPPYLPDRKQDKGRGKTDGSIVFSENSNNLTEVCCLPMFPYSPIAGDFFLFPAGLRHSVYPFRTPDGKGIRRSIAFNVGAESQSRYVDQGEALKKMLTQYDKDKVIQLLLQMKDEEARRKPITDEDNA